MRLKKLSEFSEAVKDTVVFSFGRFNPPTIGHEKVIDTVKKIAGSNPFRIYPSHTVGPKDPLSHTLKTAYLRKIFPKYKNNIVVSKARNAIDIAVELYDEGFKNIIMVVGSDRLAAFTKMLNQYNGVEGKKHGYYKFDSLEVVSAGRRDPDAEGVEGMSASKMRAAAADGDYDTFVQGIPKDFKDVKKLFRDVRKGMGIREEKDMGHMDDFETIRDAYLVGKIWNIDDLVESNGIEGRVVNRGTNYLSFCDGTGKVHKAWLHEIELDEGLLDKIKAVSAKFTQTKDFVKEKIKKLKKALSAEKAETKKMLAIYKNRKQASKSELKFANDQFKDVLKAVGLVTISVIPIPGGGLLLGAAIQAAKTKFNIDILPSAFYEEVELNEEPITLTAIGLAALATAAKVGIDIVAPHAALAVSIWWMLPVGMGMASKLAIAINVAAWALPSFLAAIGSGASIMLALKNTQKKVKSKIDGKTPEELKKLPTKPSDKADILKVFKKSKVKTAIKEEVELDERNYAKEYANYQGTPEQIARRSSRNKARRAMGDKVVKGKDVGHKDNDPLNNDPKNLRNEDPSKNRREPRLREANAPDIKKGDTIILNKAKRPYTMAGITDPKKTLPAESDKMVVNKITKTSKGRKAHLTYHDTKKRGGFAIYLDKMPDFMSVKIAEEVELDEAWFNDIAAKMSQIIHPKGWDKVAKMYAAGMKDPEHRKHPSAWASEVSNNFSGIAGRQLIKYINKLVDDGKLPKELKAELQMESFKDFVEQMQNLNEWGEVEEESEYQGRKVTLNKPSAGDVKKSKVYVKNEKGNVVKVNFGDPNMTIKKSNPARRKSFRARHNCDNPGPKWMARYWSCKAW